MLCNIKKLIVSIDSYKNLLRSHNSKINIKNCLDAWDY
jgi:hypothetical protein